MAKTTWLVPKT